MDVFGATRRGRHMSFRWGQQYIGQGLAFALASPAFPRVSLRSHMGSGLLHAKAGCSCWWIACEGLCMCCRGWCTSLDHMRWGFNHSQEMRDYYRNKTRGPCGSGHQFAIIARSLALKGLLCERAACFLNLVGRTREL